jgi:hypothetical protein
MRGFLLVGPSAGPLVFTSRGRVALSSKIYALGNEKTFEFTEPHIYLSVVYSNIYELSNIEKHSNAL